MHTHNIKHDLHALGSIKLEIINDLDQNIIMVSNV